MSSEGEQAEGLKDGEAEQESSWRTGLWGRDQPGLGTHWCDLGPALCPSLQEHLDRNAPCCLRGAVLAQMPSLGWPLGTGSQGGTRHKGALPVLCPQVSPAVALGSLHTLPVILAWSDVPVTTSASQSSPVPPSSSTGAKQKRGVFQSSFNLLRATSQEEQFFLKKIPSILPRQAFPCH